MFEFDIFDERCAHLVKWRTAETRKERLAQYDEWLARTSTLSSLPDEILEDSEPSTDDVSEPSSSAQSESACDNEEAEKIQHRAFACSAASFVARAAFAYAAAREAAEVRDKEVGPVVSLLARADMIKHGFVANEVSNAKARCRRFSVGNTKEINRKSARGLIRAALASCAAKDAEQKRSEAVETATDVFNRTRASTAPVTSTTVTVDMTPSKRVRAHTAPLLHQTLESEEVRLEAVLEALDKRIEEFSASSAQLDSEIESLENELSAKQVEPEREQLPDPSTLPFCEKREIFEAEPEREQLPDPSTLPFCEKREIFEEKTDAARQYSLEVAYDALENLDIISLYYGCGWRME